MEWYYWSLHWPKKFKKLTLKNWRLYLPLSCKGMFKKKSIHFFSLDNRKFCSQLVYSFERVQLKRLRNEKNDELENGLIWSGNILNLNFYFGSSLGKWNLQTICGWFVWFGHSEPKIDELPTSFLGKFKSCKFHIVICVMTWF